MKRAGGPPTDPEANREAKKGLEGHHYLTLGALGAGAFTIALDITAMNVAIPSIESDFNVGIEVVEWVVNAYLLAYAALVVTGGRLADMFGRRRVCFVGMGIFALMSLVGGLALDENWLIAARAIQGFGGALMWPALLGMAYAVVPRQNQGAAIGFIVSVAALGTASGPALGGVFTELWSWRLVLLFNLPVVAIAALIIHRRVSEQRDRDATGAIDYWGIVTFALGMVGILLAIVQSGTWGWGSASTIAALFAGAAMLVVFALVERRAAQPLVPADVARNVNFVMPTLVAISLMVGFLSIMFFVPQYMTKFRGFTVLEAGLGTLPLSVTCGLVSPFAGRIYDRVGPKKVVVTAGLLQTLGAVLLGVIDEDASYWTFVPGLVVFGAGVGVGISGATTAAVSAVKDSQASLASGLNYMVRVAVGTIGFTITTYLVVTGANGSLAGKLRSLGVNLSNSEIAALRTELHGDETAVHSVASLPAGIHARISEAVQQSFLAGFHEGMLFCAAVSAVGMLVALLFVGGKPHLRRHRFGRSSRVSGVPFPADVQPHD